MWFLRVGLALVCLTCVLSAPRSKRQSELDVFQLSDVIPLQSRFAQLSWNGTWISDTEVIFRYQGNNNIYKRNIVTDQEEVHISGDDLETMGTTNPIFSPDGLYMLAATDQVQGFRHSSTARYALYNVESMEESVIADHEHLQLCLFSGAGHALGFVLENNVFFRSDAGNEYQITDDGIPGVIYNGHADWVYEEEVLYSGAALWFSRDGVSLAFASFDDTEVETYTYYHYGDPQDMEAIYPEIIDLKYPKVGRINPNVTLRVMSINHLIETDGDFELYDLPAPIEIVTDDHILGSVTFASTYEVAAVWLNRRQNRSALHICNYNYPTVQCATERIHEEPRGWIESSQIPQFHNDGGSFIDLNWDYQNIVDEDESDGWRHIVHYTRTPDGEVRRSPITDGRRTVVGIVGWNQDQNYYLFTATEVDEPWKRQLYVYSTYTRCISCDIVMEDGTTCGLATASASPNAEYVAVICQERDQPSVTKIIHVSDETFSYNWQNNSELRQTLEQYELPDILIDTFPLEGGYDAPVRLFLPPGLDRSDTETKYPMIVYVYAGPNTQTVLDSFTVGYHSYLTTNRRVIYCTIDGRGSGLKGQDMLFEINNGMGSVEIDDQLIILQMILDKYEFIDQTNIGMWGWSYGGYATALALQKDTNNLLKCGIAVAPVTSWLYYDTIYTERYMGLPNEEDNLAGYEAGDVNRYAELLRGKKFFLIHGNADDNVHYQNAMALTIALQRLDIEFDQMSYPDEAHSLAGVSRHVYEAIDRFWADCLDFDNSV